ncbi:hypothetical protein HY990_04910 [Candidatus Micrarchaeota archaeon]|nr:hypothetical protein [Candidatus Micrarchaeota archaeon]
MHALQAQPSAGIAAKRTAPARAEFEGVRNKLDGRIGILIQQRLFVPESEPAQPASADTILRQIAKEKNWTIIEKRFESMNKSYLLGVYSKEDGVMLISNETELVIEQLEKMNLSSSNKGDIIEASKRSTGALHGEHPGGFIPTVISSKGDIYFKSLDEWIPSTHVELTLSNSFFDPKHVREYDERYEEGTSEQIENKARFAGAHSKERNGDIEANPGDQTTYVRAEDGLVLSDHEIKKEVVEALTTKIASEGYVIVSTGEIRNINIQITQSNDTRVVTQRGNLTIHANDEQSRPVKIDLEFEITRARQADGQMAHDGIEQILKIYTAEKTFRSTDMTMTPTYSEFSTTINTVVAPHNERTLERVTNMNVRQQAANDNESGISLRSSIENRANDNEQNQTRHIRDEKLETIKSIMIPEDRNKPDERNTRNKKSPTQGGKRSDNQKETAKQEPKGIPKEKEGQKGAKQTDKTRRSKNKEKSQKKRSEVEREQGKHQKAPKTDKKQEKQSKQNKKQTDTQKTGLNIAKKSEGKDKANKIRRTKQTQILSADTTKSTKAKKPNKSTLNKTVNSTSQINSSGSARVSGKDMQTESSNTNKARRTRNKRPKTENRNRSRRSLPRRTAQVIRNSTRKRPTERTVRKEIRRTRSDRSNRRSENRERRRPNPSRSAERYYRNEMLGLNGNKNKRRTSRGRMMAGSLL